MFLVQGAPTSLLIKNAAMHTFEQSHDLVAKEATTYRLQEKWAFACLLETLEPHECSAWQAFL
eukprot:102049-Pelagomonas_calceolata.AAC.2